MLGFKDETITCMYKKYLMLRNLALFGFWVNWCLNSQTLQQAYTTTTTIMLVSWLPQPPFQEADILLCSSASFLCGLLVASTAAWCARRAAARSSLLINTSPNESITISILIASSYPCVAAMIQCFTALSILSSKHPSKYLASGWPPMAASSAWWIAFHSSFSMNRYFAVIIIIKAPPSG